MVRLVMQSNPVSAGSAVWKQHGTPMTTWNRPREPDTGTAGKPRQNLIGIKVGVLTFSIFAADEVTALVLLKSVAKVDRKRLGANDMSIDWVTLGRPAGDYPIEDVTYNDGRSVYPKMARNLNNFRNRLNRLLSGRV